VWMKIRVSGTQQNVGFDAPPSGERLYRKVEVALRADACERATPADPGCDPEEIETGLPDLSQVEDYLLWQDHRVTPDHALTLASAFSQAFGQLVDDFTQSGPGFIRQRDGMLHLFGTHQLEDVEGESWVHVDKDFTTGPFIGHELMADFLNPFSSYLPETIVFDADPVAQGFAVAQEPPHLVEKWDALRRLGAVPVLTFVREALVEGSEADAFAQQFFLQASPVLPEIDRAIGARSVIVRPKLERENTVCASPGSIGTWASTGSPVCPRLLVVADAFNEFENEVDVITRPDDPLDELTIAPLSRQLHTIAVSPSSVGYDGVDRAALDGYPTISGTAQAYSSFAQGYERRSFGYSSPEFPFRALLLRGQPQGSDDLSYMWLSPHSIGVAWAYFTTSRGALHDIAQGAMRVLSYDWSRPGSDAFGLPSDWVPPADASLVGGSPGEPSYQYYLRSAKEAAREATAAVQTSIDNLIEESLQTVELEAAEQRAQTISEIESRALCGPSQSCDISRVPWRPEIRNCSPDSGGAIVSGSAFAHCTKARDILLSQLPYVNIAQTVREATAGDVPTFPEFEGSETQRILIRQWNAKRVLELSVNNAIDLAIATGREIAASQLGLLAATLERDAVAADINAQIAQLDDQDTEIAALISEMEDAQSEIIRRTGVAISVRARECDPPAYENAVEAGKSFSKVTDVSTVEVWFDGDMSWSAGPLRAQYDRCENAKDQAYLAVQSAAPALETLGQKIAALTARSETLNHEQKAALIARRAAAEAAFTAGTAAAHAAQQSAWVQFGAQLTHVQQAIGELVAAVAELSQVQVRSENAMAAANLERDLAQKLADERFGLRRKFRSYDMWRARALLESARRLAVAARRAIEARFVVDLSELNTPQAFVAPPAIWADEVYRDDLNAPSVVGLSVAPQIENAVFPNQLLDYVGNLERFVQGYTVTYPTSVASPDTEVLTIPGPVVVQQIARPIVNEEAEQVGEEIVDVLSGDSLGWSFFCPESGGWFPHPVLGPETVVGEPADCGENPESGGACTGTGLCEDHPSCECVEDEIVCGGTFLSRLREMCHGKMPTRARYNFSLDPWARPNRAIRSMPFEQRHNVRWGRLAVNLLGTGIRDCQQSANPAACYSESFLRFQLQHSGPAWATNHARQWRAFDLPTAFIEGGKALSSEEWLDPIMNSWNTPYVSSVARGELFGRPVGGSYDLILELSPDVRLERIQQVQLLVETEYWVRQQ
jgi:hypothetical protein